MNRVSGMGTGSIIGTGLCRHDNPKQPSQTSEESEKIFPSIEDNKKSPCGLCDSPTPECKRQRD
ncbi:MAG: hypothetical protein ACOY3I_03850 [Verrucomicrobiota bacterium]